MRKDVAKLKTQISNLNVESRDNIQVELSSLFFSGDSKSENNCNVLQKTLRDEVEVAERKLAKEIKSKRALELQATKEDQIQQEKVSRLKVHVHVYVHVKLFWPTHVLEQLPAQVP